MAWGSGAIRLISEQLQRELPGLRGFGERQIRNMQKFYQEWSQYIILQPAAAKFNAEEFASLSFTHHIEILDRVKPLDERLFYIHQSYINHWAKYELRDHLKWDDNRE